MEARNSKSSYYATVRRELRSREEIAEDLANAMFCENDIYDALYKVSICLSVSGCLSACLSIYIYFVCSIHASHEKIQDRLCLYRTVAIANVCLIKKHFYLKVVWDT